MGHSTKLACGAALAAVLTMTGMPAYADPDASPRVLTVSGDGEVQAVPDQAQLSAGVVTDGKTAAAALAANSRAMNEVFAAIRKLGVPDKSIQTTGLSVSPQYPSYNSTDEHRITGYQVSNQIIVTLDDVSKAGPMLDALIAAGANQASNIDFGIRDNKPLLAQAREAAIADAITRAQTYAKAAGVALGPILSIQEGGIETPRPVMMRAAAFAQSTPAPVAAGEESVSASVAVSWEIK